MRGHALRLPVFAAGILGGVALVNVVLARSLAAGSTRDAVLIAGLPALLVAVGGLVASDRSILVFGAMALAIIGGPVNKAFAVGGGALVYPSDVIVLLALGAWIAAWLAGGPANRPQWPRTTTLGWPFLLFATFIVAAVVRGHERYDVGLLSGPMLRLVVYAGIAAAIAGLTPQKAYRGLVLIFYAGAVYHASVGAYHLATGTSSGGGAGELSTGGVRYVALSTTIYLTGALVLALRSLELDRSAGRRAVHLTVAGASIFGIVLSFGRITWLVVAFVLLGLLLTSSGSRSALASVLPLFVPVVVLVVVLLPRWAPDLAVNVERRVEGSLSTDSSRLYREQADAAILEQVRESPITGVGFGRPITFTVDGQRITQGQDPHNGFLYMWAVGGLLALGSFVLVMLAFLADAWARFRRAVPLERTLVLFAVATWLVFMANVTTQPWLGAPKLTLPLWILLLLPTVVPRRPAQFRRRFS